ncbi:MAG: endonuclease/exonuclease/phosphatase family protein [Acinetobacter sp.]|nr:MAG: endonuclease/exonuclease/phosphatase family protein [Acinetobacter sp.]
MKILTLLLFTLFGTQITYAQDKPMKFLSYNILEGMKLDTGQTKPVFAAWLKKQDPDVLALQEVTGFTQESLEKLANSYGHPYAVLLIEGEKFPVAITSKYPITNVKKVFDNMDRGFILAEIQGYQVGVLHFTPFDYRKRRAEVALLLAEIKSVQQAKKWVIMGDFNTVSPVDAEAYADGKLVIGYQNYEKKYAPILKLADGKIDYTVIQDMMDRGFSDALKLKHPEFIKTVHPKAFEPKNTPDVPSRIDFIFVSPDLKKKVSSAEVIKDDFTDVRSDHYPVYITIAPK